MADGLIQNYSLTLSFPRRRESCAINTPQSGQNPGFVSLREDCSNNWIPAFAGMTLFRFNEQPWLNLCCALFLLLAFHVVPAFAEELPDPTRPPVSILAPAAAGSAEVAPPPAGLQSIIISRIRRAAIIGGETVELGGKHGDAKLIEVNEGSVVLRGAQGRQVLTLFPDVKITGRPEAKIKRQSPVGEAQSDKRSGKPVAHEEVK